MTLFRLYFKGKTSDNFFNFGPGFNFNFGPGFIILNLDQDNFLFWPGLILILDLDLLFNLQNNN